jgi:hypothetical protein
MNILIVSLLTVGIPFAVAYHFKCRELMLDGAKKREYKSGEVIFTGICHYLILSISVYALIYGAIVMGVPLLNQLNRYLIGVVQ